MKVFKTLKLASKTDINKILAFPKEEFDKYLPVVKNWLESKYPDFLDVKLSPGQHARESLFIHVLNFLSQFDTDSLSAEEIYKMRVAIIHHDIDHLSDEKKKSGERKSAVALRVWKNFISDDLQINPEYFKEIDLYIENHDSLGYFLKSKKYKDLVNDGATPEEIWKLWMKRQPNVDSKHALEMIRRMNNADNWSAGGNIKKKEREKNINNLHDYLTDLIPNQVV